jgi:hypothetical protein
MTWEVLVRDPVHVMVATAAERGLTGSRYRRKTLVFLWKHKSIRDTMILPLAQHGKILGGLLTRKTLSLC